MSGIRFPIAVSADEALEAQAQRAGRAREAAALAGGPVQFTTAPTSARYPTREAALDALAGRLDDDRPGRTCQVAPDERYLTLCEEVEGQPAPPVQPAFADGRRWPEAPRRGAPKTVFRVMVSFWRTGEAAKEAPSPGGPQARQARRRVDSAALSATELRALAQAPMRPVKPQQPLDVGLFETPIPEAPDMLIPDE